MLGVVPMRNQDNEQSCTCMLGVTVRSQDNEQSFTCMLGVVHVRSQDNEQSCTCMLGVVTVRSQDNEQSCTCMLGVVPVRSQDNEQSCTCMLGVSIFTLYLLFYDQTLELFQLCGIFSFSFHRHSTLTTLGLEESIFHISLPTMDSIYTCVYIVLVPILTRTRNDAPRCIQVLFMKHKTYNVRGLRFLHVDGSVRWCIPQHVEITHKQGKKSFSFVIHIKPLFFLTPKRSFTQIDPRLA